jgi:hypothetical protein
LEERVSEILLLEMMLVLAMLVRSLRLDERAMATWLVLVLPMALL